MAIMDLHRNKQHENYSSATIEKDHHSLDARSLGRKIISIIDLTGQLHAISQLDFNGDHALDINRPDQKTVYELGAPIDIPLRLSGHSPSRHSTESNSSLLPAQTVMEQTKPPKATYAQDLKMGHDYLYTHQDPSYGIASWFPHDDKN